MLLFFILGWCPGKLRVNKDKGEEVGTLPRPLGIFTFLPNLISLQSLKLVKPLIEYRNFDHGRMVLSLLWLSYEQPQNLPRNICVSTSERVEEFNVRNNQRCRDVSYSWCHLARHFLRELLIALPILAYIPRRSSKKILGLHLRASFSPLKCNDIPLLKPELSLG